MKLESKFDKGDILYVPYFRHEKIFSQCPDCLGSIRWSSTLPSGEDVSFSCPTCTYGYEHCGKVFEYGVVEEVDEFTVCEVLFERERGGFRYESNRSPDGVCRVVSESDLYASREEAEAALPGMVEAEEQRVRDQNQRVVNQQNEKRKKAGDMLSFYRTEKRRAMKALRDAERGLAREMGDDLGYSKNG